MGTFCPRHPAGKRCPDPGAATPQVFSVQFSVRGESGEPDCGRLGLLEGCQETFSHAGFGRRIHAGGDARVPRCPDACVSKARVGSRLNEKSSAAEEDPRPSLNKTGLSPPAAGRQCYREEPATLPPGDVSMVARITRRWLLFHSAAWRPCVLVKSCTAGPGTPHAGSSCRLNQHLQTQPRPPYRTGSGCLTVPRP